jgi:hypothetical protein
VSADLYAIVRDLTERLERLERQDRLLERCTWMEAALARIADAESGHWGEIAHEALRYGAGRC